MKFDNDKAPIALVPPEVIQSVAQVLAFGAKKYGANNWRHDLNNTTWSRTYSSIQRHLMSFWAGEDIDPESGMSHIDHAITQLMILKTAINEGSPEMDDRFKRKENASDN
jgi:hypothetical protein